MQLNSQHHGPTRGGIDLGEVPPLTLGSTDPGRYTRSGASLRWLFGALVTAVTSVALMGGALVAALDGRYVIEAKAAAPQAVSSPHSRRAAKADRVMPVFEPVSSRRIIKVGTVLRQGDEDFIAQRPYALIDASLVLDSAAIGEVPAFNARDLAVREDAAPTSAIDAIYDRPVDGEITVSVADFPLSEEDAFDPTFSYSEEEVRRQLADEGALADADTPLIEAGEAMLEDTRPLPDNVTVVLENMSELVKTAEPAAEGASASDLVEKVQRGDTLSKILLGSGVEKDDVEAIDDVLSGLGVATLRAGQTLRIAFQLDETGEDAKRRPSRFTIYEDELHVATVAMTDEGEFVLGEAPPGPPPTVADAAPAPSEGDAPTIYESLYQTAVDHDLPDAVRDKLLATFSLDVDFNAAVRPSDSLTVLHSTEGGQSEAEEILYAALTAGGVLRRFYRFKAPDGTVDYYDEEGRTGDKFLLRKPMERGVFRSGFGMRNHPILRRRRMHKGVDWAAPRGTRIYAAGDGVVKQAGWKAGYGRWVSIRHKNGYETGYAHQSRIADGIVPGAEVKQGEIIGYVGSTGFSTGPHLHYEVRVNGHPVNPLKIRLRHGRELSGETLEAFLSERDRIDALINGERQEVASR